MNARTKSLIEGYVQEACYLLTDVVDRSIDEDHALDELGEVLGHIKDIEPTGAHLPAHSSTYQPDPRD